MSIFRIYYYNLLHQILLTQCNDQKFLQQIQKVEIQVSIYNHIPPSIIIPSLRHKTSINIQNQPRAPKMVRYNSISSRVFDHVRGNMPHITIYKPGNHIPVPVKFG